MVGTNARSRRKLPRVTSFQKLALLFRSKQNLGAFAFDRDLVDAHFTEGIGCIGGKLAALTRV